MGPGTALLTLCFVIFCPYFSIPRAESALRRFKKDVTKSGHLFELRRRRYFETTTEKNIRKRAQSLRKARIARNMANKQRNIGS